MEAGFGTLFWYWHQSMRGTRNFDSSTSWTKHASCSISCRNSPCNYYVRSDIELILLVNNSSVQKNTCSCELMWTRSFNSLAFGLPICYSVQSSFDLAARSFSKPESNHLYPFLHNTDYSWYLKQEKMGHRWNVHRRRPTGNTGQRYFRINATFRIFSKLVKT